MVVAAAEPKKSLTQQLREQVEATIEQRNFHKEEADLLEEVLVGASAELADLIELATDNDYVPPKRSKAEVEEEEEEEEEEDGKGAAKRHTLDLLKKSGKTPMGEDELAIQLLRDGFQTTMDEEAFCRFVFDECVTPLIEEGEVEAVGSPPNRKFLAK